MGLVAIGIVGLLVGVTIPGGLDRLLAPAIVALVASLTYLSFFAALRIGPVAVVGPIVSAYGVVVVLIAVLVLGESLRVGQAVGVCLATVGIVLAGVALDTSWRKIRLVGPGVALALVATVGFAVNVIGLTSLIRIGGWLPTLLIWKFWTTVFACAFLLVAIAAHRGQGATETTRTRSGAGRREIALIVAAGLIDAGGTVALSIGLQVSFAWLVGLVSSFGPLSGVAAGVLILGERLKPVQGVGLFLVVLSLVLLSFG
jgi:drug/metabolite transporter (DMT)-like permease